MSDSVVFSAAGNHMISSLWGPMTSVQVTENKPVRGDKTCTAHTLKGNNILMVVIFIVTFVAVH